ncbi:type IV pilus assembly protein PilM [uncultured Clostridium sp.]|uniref:type IV pilus assembly protein PilM n=1 Tax=uncultured Clostridium sp. TaxID=59620 RepID=UPI00258635FC|nr:type IV pilus assembly protein PilM [uncultured Clostridium sp.]
MSKENFLSKLKDISSMDVKDIGKIFKKNNNESNNITYKDINTKKVNSREKSKLVLSIDLGSHSIKAVEGKIQKNIINVNKLIEVETPEGTVIDGRIIDEDTIIKTLAKLIRENNIRARDVIFTTNSSSIINRDILVPSVAVEEMDTVVRYEIQQYLPINLDDYVIQFVFLDEIVDDTGMKLKVNVTAFPERMALSYYNIINSLGLNPYVLDVTYNSINKIANYGDYTLNNGQVIGGTVAFIDMGATSIDVSILKNGKLDFTRMLKIGGDNIDYALSEKMNISIKSMELIKMKEVDLLETYKGDVQTLTIQGVVDEVLDELERVIQFYKNKSNSSIDILYIFGGMSNIKNLESYLNKRLNIRVSKIKEINNVNLGNDALFTKDLSLYLNALGSIIRL